MKQKNILLQLIFGLILVSFNLTTFGQDTSNDLESSDKINILKGLLEKPDSLTGNNSGQIVYTKDIIPSIDLLFPKMKRHGIDSSKERSKIIWRKTMKVTDWESFAGKDLLDWMTKIPTQFPGHRPDEIEIRIVFGVYTEDFLKTHVTDVTLRNSKRNRITAFLIPYLITTDKAANQRIATMGQTGYDLGGLHP